MLIKKSSDGRPAGAIQGLIALIIVFLVGFFNYAGAASAIGYSGAPFLKISPAARQVAMGEAFTALSNDVNLMRYNVGGLGGMKHPSLALNFNTWIDDTQQGNIAFAYPFKKLGVFGVDMTYFDEGQITQLDPNFVPVGGNGISGDILMSLGYGYGFFIGKESKTFMSFGLAGKYLSQSLVGEASSVFAVDAGAQMLIQLGNGGDRKPELKKYFQKYLTFGAAVQNYGLSKMKFDVWQSPLPETYKLGTAMIFPMGNDSTNVTKLTVAADALYTNKEQIKYFLGSELFIGNDFALRGGYKFNENSMSNWAAGFGVNIPAQWLARSTIRLDYAYAPLPAFDEAAHRFSLHFAFGEIQKVVIPIPPPPDDSNAKKIKSLGDKIDSLLKAQNDLKDIIASMRKEMKDLEITNVQIFVNRNEKGEIIPPLMLRVFFDFDKADIRSSEYPTLKYIGNSLNKFPEAQVHLAGHTDWIGDDEYNIKLSQRRLYSVMAYLSENEKVAMNRFFMPVGYGESRPIADNSTEAGRQQNRRVDFYIYFNNVAPPIPDGTAIKDVRALDDNTIQIECNGRIAIGDTMTLRNPDRCVIDFKNVFLLSDDKDVPLNRGPFIMARLGYHGSEPVKYTRVVLDTKYKIIGEQTVDRNYIIFKRIFKLEQSLEKKN